jgi:glycosyltransferase involved in cell wall biosynthesis
MAGASVVIPTRDRWALLERALGSVLAQEGVELEVIVIDDGSREPAPAGMPALRDPRVRLERSPRSQGVARARNLGLALAGGEWTAFLDDDDLWAPTKLARQLEAVQAAGGVLAYSAAFVTDEHGRLLGVDPAPPPDGLLRDLLRHPSMPGGCSNVVARTVVLRELDGFDERLEQLADWDLWIRLAASGAAGACPEPLVAYLDHPASMHVRRAKLTSDELVYLSTKHAALLAGAGRGPQLGGGAWFEHWVAGGQLRAGDRAGALRTYLRTARRHRSKGSLLRAAAALVTDRMVHADTTAPLVPWDGPPPDWLVATSPVIGPLASRV